MRGDEGLRKGEMGDPTGSQDSQCCAGKRDRENSRSLEPTHEAVYFVSLGAATRPSSVPGDGPSLFTFPCFPDGNGRFREKPSLVVGSAAPGSEASVCVCTWGTGSSAFPTEQHSGGEGWKQVLALFMTLGAVREEVFSSLPSSFVPLRL